ncbi:MAG: 50S ribosomal protein L9 [Actinobacteria bacterium]|nr:50S ribosomal protein L9 [Actinomycetota bacterium]
MRVVLIQDVAGVGLKGDVLEVAPGHARNYLLPRKLAVPSTPAAEERAAAIRRARLEAEERAREEAEQIAQSLAGQVVVVAARAADEGRLYGSIGARDVAEAVQKYTGVEVAPQHIDLRSPIKAIGLHEVRVRPHREVEFEFVLDVIPA